MLKPHHVPDAKKKNEGKNARLEHLWRLAFWMRVFHLLVPRMAIRAALAWVLPSRAGCFLVQLL